jgi:HrpA-like RNA helicase
LIFKNLSCPSSPAARRISAISIAERVHQEQCLPNEAVGGMIGYQVRLEAAMSAATQLQFVTPGILLRKLQGSSTLSEFTHIILDEVHERDKYTEFLLIALRDLLPRRPDLRLILMSATIQTDTLIQYFSASGMEVPEKDDAVGKKQVQFYQKHPPAVVEMEGRTFPVQEFFLEHVLQMTGYIDVSTPLEEQVAANVSSQQLEKELSLLLLQQEQQQHQKQQKDVKLVSSLNCVLCGCQGFANALDLGSHVSICDGGGVTNHLSENHTLAGSSRMDGVENEDDDGAGDQIVQASSDDGEEDKGSAKRLSLDDFEDYDEEEEAVLDGYDDFFDGTANNIIAASEPEVTTAKWDGSSPFEIMPANETLLSATEEELLTRYQSMHDDEQVDSFLLLEVLHYIVKSSHGDGAILVFFSGWQEISEIALLLDTTPPFSNKGKYLVLPLHSGIPSRDQRKVLQRPPKGTRKIILSTNIAETSLTIDDVSFVVDTGRQKLKDYDPHLKTSTLQPMWISRASSKQRKGRAGRTKAGVCFHLFSSVRHESMRPFVESELLRTPLVRDQHQKMSWRAF